MKATVCSMLPWKLYEHKVGVYPAVYRLPAVNLDDPTKNLATLVVDDAKRYRYMGYQIDDKKPEILDFVVPGETLAKSICEDYIQAKVAADLSSDVVPALFWFPEELSESDIRKKYADVVEKRRLQQITWFVTLCRMADDDWNKFHNHKVILDDQRIAASVLKIEREWNIDPLKEQIIKCSQCRTAISSLAIICPNCKFIMQPDKYKKENFAA